MYKYYNRQPLGFKEEDCVCRAISLATNSEYHKVERNLFLVGKLLDCEELCVCCYDFLIEKLYCLTRHEEYKGLLIEDFLEDHNKGIYLIRIEGHLTCAIDGVIYDIWDCSDKTIDIVWSYN